MLDTGPRGPSVCAVRIREDARTAVTSLEQPEIVLVHVAIVIQVGRLALGGGLRNVWT